ncbi:MAG: hypothetical protein ACYDBX_03120 [Patescibacteria group bacterium]
MDNTTVPDDDNISGDTPNVNNPEPVKAPVQEPTLEVNNTSTAESAVLNPQKDLNTNSNNSPYETQIPDPVSQEVNPSVPIQNIAPANLNNENNLPNSTLTSSSNSSSIKTNRNWAIFLYQFCKWASLFIGIMSSALGALLVGFAIVNMATTPNLGLGVIGMMFLVVFGAVLIGIGVLWIIGFLMFRKGRQGHDPGRILLGILSIISLVGGIIYGPGLFFSTFGAPSAPLLLIYALIALLIPGILTYGFLFNTNIKNRFNIPHMSSSSK